VSRRGVALDQRPVVTLGRTPGVPGKNAKRFRGKRVERDLAEFRRTSGEGNPRIAAWLIAI